IREYDPRLRERHAQHAVAEDQGHRPRPRHDDRSTRRTRQRVMTLLQEGTDQEQEQTPSEARPDLARLATVLTEVTSAADRTELVDSFIDAVKASVLARQPDDVGVAPVVSPRREKRR